MVGHPGGAVDVPTVGRVSRKAAGKKSRGPASTTAPAASGTAIKGWRVLGRKAGDAERAHDCRVHELAEAQYIRQSKSDCFQRLPYHQISCDTYGESSWRWRSQACEHG